MPAETQEKALPTWLPIITAVMLLVALTLLLVGMRPNLTRALKWWVPGALEPAASGERKEHP